MLRFSLAICPRASFLDHVTLSVQEYGRVPSADRWTSLRGIIAGRGGEGFGKQNQSLHVPYATDELYQRPCAHARQQLERYPLPPLGTMAQQPRCTSSTHRAVPPRLSPDQRERWSPRSWPFRFFDASPRVWQRGVQAQQALGKHSCKIPDRA